MEENLQRMFSAMLAIIVFFILPMYVAFEKKDDFSYALAVKMTSELVENVRNNGYLSQKMYSDYTTGLSVTNNSYEIKMEHKSYKYYPIICSYSDSLHTKLLQTFEYDIYKDDYLNGTITYDGLQYKNLILSYARSEEIYTEANILDVINSNTNIVTTGMTKEAYKLLSLNSIPLNPNLYVSGTLGSIYTMNKGDSFTIRIKNVNTTTAEVFFNALTIGLVTEPIPRVYVNYGCTIQNEQYKTWK